MSPDARRLALPCALLTLLLAAGCAGKESADASAKPGAPEGVEEANVRTIAETTQAIYGSLRIAVGYVHKGEFADESGAKKEGLVAGMQLLRRGVAEKVEVHEGQRVAGEPAFVVEQIKGGLKGVVRVRFDTPPPAP